MEDIEGTLQEIGARRQGTDIDAHAVETAILPNLMQRATAQSVSRRRQAWARLILHNLDAGQWYSFSMVRQMFPTIEQTLDENPTTLRDLLIDLEQQHSIEVVGNLRDVHKESFFRRTQGLPQDPRESGLDAKTILLVICGFVLSAGRTGSFR
jgi:hypothetical protein